MEERCVCCGRVIPEGQQVCPICAADLPPQAREIVERLEKFRIDIQAAIEYIMPAFLLVKVPPVIFRFMAP